MIYYIEKDYKKGVKEIDSIEEIDKIEELSLEGKSILEIEKPKIHLKNSSAEDADFLIGGTVLPVVNRKIKESLEKIDKDNFEFLEFSNLNGYYIWNILNNISCFNWEESEYTRYPEDMKELKDIPETIDKLVIDESKLDSRTIFRMNEDSINVFISEEVKERFEQQNVSGLSFCESSEYEKW